MTKNNKLFYPAIFHEAEEGGVWITFPDFSNIFSQAEDFSEAFEMAKDALGLELTDLEKDQKSFPSAKKLSEIKTEEGESLVIIEMDLMEYKRKTQNAAVKKTLSIPSWLNEAAMAEGINFSAVLQQGLKEKLGY